ncbi:hypothetical protein BJX70DRAFT_271182 [Aspergillus crustosus]
MKPVVILSRPVFGQAPLFLCRLSLGSHSLAALLHNQPANLSIPEWDCPHERWEQQEMMIRFPRRGFPALELPPAGFAPSCRIVSHRLFESFPPDSFCRRRSPCFSPPVALHPPPLTPPLSTHPAQSELLLSLPILPSSPAGSRWISACFFNHVTAVCQRSSNLHPSVGPDDSP